MKLFVTAINTDSGKTFVSAILCRAFGADYWKPVQAGEPFDSSTIRLLTNDTIVIHKEAYALKTPESPHAAAKKDGVVISLNDMQLPQTNNNLIIEGAGGCLVPLNDHDFVIDIPRKFQIPVVVVSNTYLGSINHTLLTLEALSSRSLSIAGIIFNGPANPDTEEIILRHSKLPCLLRIPKLDKVTPDDVIALATQFNENWKKLKAD